HQRVIVGQRALAHEAVGDRDAHLIDELAQLAGRPGEQHAPARIDQWTARLAERFDDRARSREIDGRWTYRGRSGLEARAGRGLELRGEDIHRNIDQDG